jgi:hypothetical protein
MSISGLAESHVLASLDRLRGRCCRRGSSRLEVLWEVESGSQKRECLI